jgi:arginine N-succinyltransferase
LFDARTQKLIGEVGEETKGVQRMLSRIGFRYVNHIDPFDGGPHYEADVDDISLVRRFRSARLGKHPLELEAEEMLVGVEVSGKHRFRAVRCPVRFDDQAASIPEAAQKVLGVKPGAKLNIIPFESP